MTPRRVLLSLALILALFSSTAAQPKEVVIGVVYPLSGPAALTGLENKVVNEIARDIANGEVDVPLPFYRRLKGMPGLKGAKVRLIFADHQGKPEVGQAEAERLITQEKVHATYGSWHSSVTATVSQVAERYGIPHVNGQSSSPGLTKRGFKWFFRTSPHDEHFTQTMFDFFHDFQKKRGVTLKTLGITYEDTIARGLMARPRLLMIDEPFLGLAPRIVDQIAETMARINREGVAILFIEQHVERALAHRGFVLESGRTVLEGRSAELLRSPEVRKVFLGG